jgi:hypothetical protein
MYQKYGMYRIVAMMVLLFGSGAVFLYVAKNKTKNMSKSVLYELTNNRLQNHQKVT